MKDDDLAQATVLARLFFNDDHPDETTLGSASWLYSDLIQSMSIAVQKGICEAFKKS